MPCDNLYQYEGHLNSFRVTIPRIPPEQRGCIVILTGKLFKKTVPSRKFSGVVSDLDSLVSIKMNKTIKYRRETKEDLLLYFEVEYL